MGKHMTNDDLYDPDGAESCLMCGTRGRPWAYVGSGLTPDGRMLVGDPLCRGCAEAIIDDDVSVQVFQAKRGPVRTALEVGEEVSVEVAPDYVGRHREPEPVQEPQMTPERPSVRTAEPELDPTPVPPPPRRPESLPEPALVGTVVRTGSGVTHDDFGLGRPGVLSLARWRGRNSW
jgi:hypothetical protein